MKKYLYLAAAALLSVAAVSCKGNEGNDPDDKGGNKDKDKAAFTITVSDVTATTANVKVTPLKDCTFYWDVIDAETFDAAEAGEFAEYEVNDGKAYVQYMLDYFVQQYSAYGYTLDDFVYTEEDEYEYENLDPETKYYVVAAVVDAEGVLQGNLTKAEFTTDKVKASTNNINMSWGDGTLTITTTNNDPYIFILEPKADYDEFEDDYSQESLVDNSMAWINTMAQYGMTDYFTYEGNQTIDVNEFWTTYMSEDPLETGVEYIAYTIPYAGAINGEVKYIFFVYGSAGVAPLQVKGIENRKIMKQTGFAPKSYKTFVK